MTNKADEYSPQSELEVLTTFLKDCSGVWNQEVLNAWPQSIANYDPHWLQEISELSEEEKWHLECRRYKKTTDSKIIALFEQIIGLETIPDLLAPIKSCQYPSWAFQKVSGKKQHEIRSIASLLAAHNTDRTFPLLDIGGGVGHLGRVISLYHGENVCSLDANKEFQDIGQKRLQKYPLPKDHGKLTFVHHHFNGMDEKIKSLIKDHHTSVGLHTCGPLALRHLELSSYDKHRVINFGCCYQKLSPQTDTNLSQWGKSNGLTLSKYALTLASRGTTRITFEQYQLKRQVKLYRAALHLFLAHHYGMNDFVTLGSSLPRIYRQNFTVYAQEKIASLNLDPVSSQKLDSFYQSEQTQQTIAQIYHANLIRWQFSRLIEKYILLDRVLWLRDQNIPASLTQVFDRNTSPRNVAILCHL